MKKKDNDLMFDMKNMMQQAQQMQFKMAELQEKFKEIFVDGESGGGMVKVNMACSGDIKSIAIDPAVIDPEDKETLEDLVLAAINSAMKAKEDKVMEETQASMQAMGLPAGTKMPF
jgi:DNA-binding YbaB/EbfC family protein